MSQFNKRRSLLLVSLKNMEFDEDKVIEEALTTPYEKVMKILNRVKAHLHDHSVKYDLIKDLDWVIDRISSHNLYAYDVQDQKKEFEQIANNSHEVKTFFEYLNNYSEAKQASGGRNNNTKSKTGHLDDTHANIIKYKLKNEENVDNNNHLYSYATTKFANDQNTYKKFKKSFTVAVPNQTKVNLAKKVSNRDILEESSIYQDENIGKNSEIDFKMDEIATEVSKDHFSSEGDDENLEEKLESIIIEPDSENIFSLSEQNFSEDIFSNNFNIFDFESKVGRSNVLPHGARLILNSLNLTKLISSEYLDNFLSNVRDGYIKEAPYHNDMHGFDVCQTLSTFLCKTDISVHLRLDEYDILSVVLSALMHDLGHPGYNNSFQINSLSDMAITYNDKSVLENYHVSLGFKILRNPESNITRNFNLNEFKHLRKRIIECILSTDMIFHAKIHSMVKNKLASNDIKYGANIEHIVDKRSADLFDEQQIILNFLIHTADVSHNSKEFKISSKWTDLLMQEFWKQGDAEKGMGYPVSFLCDRTTAEVPKSQIGFIKSIIIPTFETLVDMLPRLNFYKENVYNNLDQWSEMVVNESKDVNQESQN